MTQPAKPASSMQTIVLVIGVILKGNSILMRKKPDGSPPYKQTWYLFGGELTSENHNPQQVLKDAVKAQAGINIKIDSTIGWDTEVKPSHDGLESSFIYLDCICSYESGELAPGPGIEKLEWVPINELSNYDLVPPTVKLLKKLKYI